MCASGDRHVFRANTVEPVGDPEDAGTALRAAVTSQRSVSRKRSSTWRTSASSSTTSTRRPSKRSSACAASSARFSAASSWRGRYSVTVVPAPGALRSVTAPWLCLAKPYTVLRPRPVPRPASLVVKKGSKARSRTSSGMPQPLSAMAIAT